ncbi:MAG: ECF transporter S component [Filifactoraceae bacterium]
MKKYAYRIMAIFILLMGLGLSTTLFEKNVGACILVGLVGVITMFFAIFEVKGSSTEKVVLIALLSSVSAIGRVLFASIPSVQPSSFIIMMAGIVFGGEVGFLTGAITALTSNLMLGQGPWTVWQMFSWGIMGLASAALRKPLMKSRLFFMSYGLVWGFIFGWIMNAWVVLGGFGGEPSWATIIPIYIASFYFDLAHGVANVVFIAMFCENFYKIFGRISIKYGLGVKEM